jgi:hypothetical protein
MRKSNFLLGGAAALALLAGCGGRNEGAGGLSADEERALDNAAAMLDSNNIDVSADSMVANEADVATEENAADEGDNAAGNDIAE